MNKILDDAILYNASDIHIYPDFPIKYRIKGELKETTFLDNLAIESLISLLKFNANIDISLNKLPQSGRFEYYKDDNKYYLRISTIPLNEVKEGCVIRIFTDKIDEVNFSIFEEDCEKIKSQIVNANGLIIFSGPTGSGKSTSMYKLAIDIANKNKQVISIEDPIEKNIEKIVQMQVNEKAGINYDNALKSILRCDPDVIMVGEIRDKITAKYVITSAYSGHLVLTTLHAEDCKGVINRLKDLDIGKEDLKQTIICVISQRLVKLKQGEQSLITEILDKNNLISLIEKDNVMYPTFEEKFERAIFEGKIDVIEKEKWGY